MVLLSPLSPLSLCGMLCTVNKLSMRIHSALVILGPFKALAAQMVTNAMMTSWHNDSCVTDPLWGEYTGHMSVRSQRASNAGFHVFFGVNRNKLVNKRPCGRWFETPWRSLDVIIIYVSDVRFRWADKFTSYGVVMFGTSNATKGNFLFVVNRCIFMCTQSAKTGRVSVTCSLTTTEWILLYTVVIKRYWKRCW